MIDDEIIQEALADGRFEPSVWLTFYLFGDPAALKAMKPELIEMDAANLDGDEGGCLYAKVPVQLDRKVIEKTINAVRSLGLENDVRIDIIDLDSSPSVGSSTFITLWAAP